MILAHILQVEKVKLNFRRFANEKTASCLLFIASFIGLKTQKIPTNCLLLANKFLNLKWLKIYIFEKIIGLYVPHRLSAHIRLEFVE